jgi:hypothetical protein
MVTKPEESVMAQKTLGMTWHPQEDILTFAIQPWDKGPVTTLRRLASYAPTLFDPQGLLLPLTLIAKIIISVVCAARAVVNVEWDTPLEPLIDRVVGLDNVLKKWVDYTDSLSDLPAIKFPRAVRSGPAITIELHLFTDASEMAYAAVIYIKSTRADGTIQVEILCAKNRIAHLGQSRTIAEMELLGIFIGAKMADRVIGTLERVDKVFLWTDSRVCQHWIAKPARQWKSFVAHRVTTIYSLTKDYTWRHVPGKQNPADLATRGLSMSQFKADKMWRHGPKFLMGPEDQYPQWTPEVTNNDILPIAKTALMASLPTQPSKRYLLNLMPDFNGNQGGKIRSPLVYSQDGKVVLLSAESSLVYSEDGKVIMVSKIGRPHISFQQFIHRRVWFPDGAAYSAA